MDDLELARHTLRAYSLAFAIAKDGALLCTGTREGIGELIEAVDALGSAARGACLADKIVGKPVALIVRAAQIRAVYASLASAAARNALAHARILLEYERLVPGILNKRGDGPCPMERLALSIDDPNEAVIALREFVARGPVSVRPGDAAVV